MAKLTKQIILALILGVIAGIILTFVPDNIFTALDTYLLNPVGQIFLNLILMTVVPIVFVSIVLGVAGLGDPNKLGRIGLKTVSFFLLSTAIALSIGVLVATIFQPGNVGSFNLEVESYEVEEPPPMMETLVNIIPDNPVAALASGDI